MNIWVEWQDSWSYQLAAIGQPWPWQTWPFLDQFPLNQVKLTSDSILHQGGRGLSIIAQSIDTHNILHSGHQTRECHLSLICEREAEKEPMRRRYSKNIKLYIWNKDDSLTRGHHLRVGGSQAILGDTSDSVASDWSLSRRPVHCEGVVTHISQFHVSGGLGI